MWRTLFVVFSLLIIAWELRLNWRVARFRLAKIKALDGHLTHPEHARWYAQSWLVTQLIHRQMISPVGVILVAILAFDLFSYPFSWSSAMLISVVLTHSALLWVAQNHVLIMEKEISDLDSEALLGVLRAYSDLRKRLSMQ